MDISKPSSLKSDILAGFLVSLIALPLCLGIAGASGAPPVSGILTAIVGGVAASLLGSAPLTIKGPAAGLIAIVYGAITDLGQGDLTVGYHRALAVWIVAGCLQALLARFHAGTFCRLMPSSVVNGMLAAIGVIIIAKQSHVLLGVKPVSQEPLALLAEIPRSFMQRDGAALLIGLVALIVLIGFPYLSQRFKALKSAPAPLLVLLFTIPLASALPLTTSAFVKLPNALTAALAYPDFSHLATLVSLKYIVLFALIGSVESLLTVSAIDQLSPEKKDSDLNKDLLSTGIANVIAACIGGIPMISEVVRSKANIDNGAKSAWANFFHGIFLLLAVALIPDTLQKIPLAALAAMLLFTGSRLASIQTFRKTLALGRVELLLFVTTMIVTLATDLLMGVLAGIALHLLARFVRSKR